MKWLSDTTMLQTFVRIERNNHVICKNLEMVVWYFIIYHPQGIHRYMSSDVSFKRENTNDYLDALIHISVLYISIRVPLEIHVRFTKLPHSHEHVKYIHFIFSPYVAPKIRVSSPRRLFRTFRHLKSSLIPQS